MIAMWRKEVAIAGAAPEMGQVLRLFVGGFEAALQIGGCDGAGATGAALVQQGDPEVGNCRLEPRAGLARPRRLEARAACARAGNRVTCQGRIAGSFAPAWISLQFRDRGLKSATGRAQVGRLDARVSRQSRHTASCQGTWGPKSWIQVTWAKLDFILT
jgi:hypothetical protein